MICLPVTQEADGMCELALSEQLTYHNGRCAVDREF